MRLRGWRDLSEGDVKIFLAHLVAMGLVRKGNLEKYWDHRDTVKTPFFGTYMGRNTFQSILSNFQVSNKHFDLPRNHPNHDPLFKVRPMIDMMDRTFLQVTNVGGTPALMRAAAPKGAGAFSLS